MNRADAVLRLATSALSATSRRFALIGGWAVSARTEPRFTRDIDLAVAVADDAEAESLLLDLQGRGFRVVAVVEQEAQGRLATARLLPPGEDDEGMLVDLLFASSGIEREVVSEAEPVEVLPGLPVGVARTGHLIALKLLSRDDETRPQDSADLRALKVVLTFDEVGRARRATALIEARGFNRGRALSKVLDVFLEAGHGGGYPGENG